MVEEPGEHLASRVGGEKVCFVALDDSGVFVPVVIALEEDVVDGVSVAAVGACGVVPSIPLKVGGVVGVECMSSDELESC